MVSIQIPASKRTRPSDCIWCQAGVVRHKTCRNDYLCASCRFDRAMRRVARENQHLMEMGTSPSGRKGAIVFWQDRLRKKPHPKRPCLHHMKGRIEFRACINDYHCANCEFDQYFRDQFMVYAMVNPVDVLHVDGIRIPQGYYLHHGHTWLKLEEDATVRVGLDDFALRLTGPPDQIHAPLIGKHVTLGAPDITLQRRGHQADVFSPISGVVTAINHRLRENGSLAHEDPYSGGWIMQIHAENLREELKALMLGSETEGFLKQEIDHLYALIEAEVGPLATDGGTLSDDIFGNLPGVDWQRLTRPFLRS